MTRLVQAQLFGSAEALPPPPDPEPPAEAPAHRWEGPARERRGLPKAPRRRPSLESPLSQMTLPGAAPEATWQRLCRSAKRGPARDAWPVRPWAEYIERWSHHATTVDFKARVAKALDIARAGAARGRLLCSLSGGKDSTALAGVLHEAGLAIEGVYASCVLNYPDCEETLALMCAKLGCQVTVLRPAGLDRHVKRICRRYGTSPPRPTGPGGTFSEWDVLKCFPKDVCLTDDGPFKSLGKAFGCANLVVAYRYSEEGKVFDGSFHGVRAAESTRRYIGSRAYGALFKSPADGSWTCTPIVKWSGKDVMAFLHSRGLPLHPYYKAAFETGLARDDPSKIRVGSIVGTELAGRGRMTPVARVYPKFWAKVTRARPELARFAAISPQL